jgi:amidase
MPADLHFLSLDELARSLGTRALSSVEATRALLDRIRRIDPALKSYATVTADRALAQAAARDAEAAAGRSRGPLHGVPIAVKDLCDVAGVPTGVGMAIHRNTVPDRDSTVVARLEAAGAVLLGKLQMTEGAFGAHHPSIAAPLNPWNPSYWTGASSSGSGAATAAGLCHASLGSDTGGSIRFPSAMNGLSGLKPSWGRVSRAGVFPLAESLDHVGPMARSARDCAIMLAVIAGPDPDDPTAAAVPVPDYVAAIDGGVRGRRIGLPARLGDLDADSQSALAGAASGLEKAGATIVEVDLPAGFDQASRDWTALCSVETALAHEATYPSRAGDYGPVLAGLIDMGRRLPALEYARLQRRRAILSGAMNGLFASIDLLLMPVMPVAAWSLDRLAAAGRDPDAVAARLRYTAPFDLTGHPSLTLPGGLTKDGVPTGFQIVGRMFGEAAVLAAGHAYQQASDWHLRRPPLAA